MKKQFLLYSLLLLVIHTNWAQKDAKMQADKAYDQLSYLKAADLYQQLGESGLDEMAKIRLADSYRLNGDTESAEYWYAQAVQAAAAPEDILHYAQVLQSNGKCEQALDWYHQYRQLMGDAHDLPRATITDCSNLLFSPKQQVTVTNLQSLNSAHLDYSPVPYKGGIVFTSTRGKGKNAIEDTWTKGNFSDLFFAQQIGDQNYSAAQLLAGSVNGDFHDGTATFNKTGTVMYFARNNDKGKNANDVVDLKIYRATLNNKKWGDVVALPFNDDEFATCHPTLSADGSTLYFSSNRLGGFGGMDLYKSTRSGSYWSVPENLGETINTAGNELFPFIDPTGMLYFASDGLPGVGGLDVYQAHLTNGTWSQPENLGEPINSSKDDFGYSKLSNGKAGYFTSNRAGGLGSDDIYYWSGSLTVVPNKQNIITIVDETSNDRITDALVTIIEGVYKNKSSIPSGIGKQVKNGEAPTASTWAQPISFLTDVQGKIQPEVKDGKTYTILVEKQGYATVKKVINAYDLMRKPEWIIPLPKRKGLALNGTVIHQEYNRMIPNAAVTLFNFCTGEYESTTTDDEGSFAFFLECNCDYEIVAKKERFVADKKKYSTLGIDCQSAKPVHSILYLNVAASVTSTPKTIIKSVPTSPVNVKPTETLKVGQVITLEEVYYDFNKATIRGDASKSLDHLIDLLQRYPSMKIELYSHTDSRGNHQYNEQLSQRRAAAAVQYIQSRGIAGNRLTGKGFGESLLKNDCADGVDCEEWQHQENRRTEVKITHLDADVAIKYR